MRLLLLLQVIQSITASAGDRDLQFQQCLKEKCTQDCYLPFYLKLSAWSCLDDCKYNCMQQVSTTRSSRGQELLQYYGKWPFTRILGVQEPASVLFSLGNMYAHIKGLKKLTKFKGNWKNLYFNFGMISIGVWTASTLFHARDFPITEKLDYFMAILGLEYSFYLSFLKAWSLSNASTVKRILSLYYMCHVLYLSRGSFNYSYNMIVGITLGLLTNFHWLLWYYRIGYKNNYGWKQVAFTFGICLAMSLEVWDFSPIFGLLDAHSLWHLATIPLVFLHYSFLYDDLSDGVKQVFD
jgi:hypothetical protein